MKQSKKLWQVDEGPHPLVEAYTVGEDYLFDQQLLPFDIQGTKAHAAMLAEMKIVTATELVHIEKTLDALLIEWERGSFFITQDQEDCHTAIEQYLVLALGDLGKKIHTGRSRNDQTLVMTRLYEKAALQDLEQSIQTTSKAFSSAAERHKDQQMPGYTHMQRAMPTTVGTWLHAFADGFTDSRLALACAKTLIDQNPLGSASGFGIGNFPLQRESTTKELGFAKTQDNPMYCGLSRGLFEIEVLHALTMPMMLAGRFASDMLLFTTDEFNFVRLPKTFTTGSSIMPNKQNYDLFEIMRGNVRVFTAYQQEIQQIVGGLYSGYSRDLQLTKPPLIRGLELAKATLELLTTVVPELLVQPKSITAAMSSDLFATEQVYELVKQGMSFRDAYLSVKATLAKQAKT
ncbi:MAG TPA: argininosuccinate lyase [Patescibacteria group bacterium]|nr:argininosuccinate lyase [Patescibacteria group bacterium]